jgi:threonine/homoserine/homoserine lactone efflux protein
LLLITSITLIDGLYIALSGLGIATIINKKRIRLIIKIFGGAVLIFFGNSTIAGALGSNLLPSFGQISMKEEGNIFLRGLLLTASNLQNCIPWEYYQQIFTPEYHNRAEHSSRNSINFLWN